MDDIINQLVEKHKLNENEKYLCQYMIENIDQIAFISSREFARKTYTNSTAILRFIKKLGFSNYNDFKVHINSYIRNLNLNNKEIMSQEDLLSVVNKISDIEKYVIDSTKDSLSITTLKDIVEALDKAKYIDVIANDANAQIAEYASHNFCYIGKIMTVYTNLDKQLYLSLNANKEHVVIIISKYEDSKSLFNVAIQLKARGIQTIAICSKKDSLLAKRCTYSIIGFFNESFHILKDMAFNISTKYIFDLLFVSLFSKEYNNTIELEQMNSQLYRRRL